MVLCDASNAYAIQSTLNASDVLGQVDDTHAAPGPVYTKVTANNVPDKFGLSAPMIGMALDAVGNRLFVTDTTNNRVLVYNTNANDTLIDRIPDHVLGQPNFYTNATASTQTGFETPNGIALSGSTTLFVAEGAGSRVKVFDVTAITDGESAVNVLGQLNFTATTAAVTQDGMSVPQDVLYDRITQRLFVSDSTANRVTVYDVAQISNGEAATGVLGQANFTGTTAATTQAGMNVPFGLALSGSTTLFVSQGTGNRVTTYDVSTVTDGENAVKVLGQTDFTGTALGNTQSGMNAPRGIAYSEATKKLYVSQTTGNRVTVYDVAAITDGENAVSVLGQSVFTVITAAVTQAGMSGPNGVIIDAANNFLYVLQSGASRVSVFDIASIADGEDAVGVLGQYDDAHTAPGPIYTKGTANNAPDKFGLSAPQGVALDATNHRLFVADSSNNRILVYNLNADNTPIDRIPDNVLGQANFYSNAVATTQAGLSLPTGLTFDSTANYLFASDFTNNRIMVFDTASIADGENAVAVLGQAVFTVATAGTTQVGLSGPRQLQYDGSTRQLFVADTTNNRIVIYDVATVESGETMTNILGQYDENISAPGPIYTKGTANNVPHRLGMSAPVVGIALDATGNRLFVSDTVNNRVLVYNTNANDTLIDRIPDHVLGQPNFYSNAAASTQEGFETPRGLALSGSTVLFVAEGAGSRVKLFDVTTITDGESAIGVLGQVNFTATAAATTQGGMSAPFDVTYDEATKRLYVADGTLNRVTVYNLAPGLADGPNAVDVIGQYDDTHAAPGPVYTKGTANNAPDKFGLSAPMFGLALDSVGNRLFVSDTVNNRVLVYNTNANDTLIDRIPDNVLGQANFYSNAAASTQSGFETPNGLALSGSTTLFVAEGAGSRVKVFDVTAITDGESAVNVLGQVNFTATTAGVTQVGMSVPQDLAYDRTTKRLYVSDSTANRVTVYDVSTIHDGENAIGVLGQANFTGTTAATTQAGMNVPFGLALSGSTTLFVSQGTGNRVTTYDVMSISDGENAVNVLGQTDFTGTALGNTQSGMNAPRGITYDTTTKKLYVSQTTGNRVTVYDVAAITDGENAVSVLGQSVFTVITAAVTQAGLSGPNGVIIDAANNFLYVLQSGASRVSVFDIASIGDGENAVDVLGQYDDTHAAPGPIYTKGTANNAPDKFGLSAPIIGMALDAVGNRLFVTDTTNNRVLVYNTNANDTLIDRIPDNVLGQANFYSNAAASTQTGLETPNGLALSGSTALFVAEGAGSRVKVFDVTAITDGESAVNVLGQVNFTGTTAGTTQAGMSAPQDVLYDPITKRLYVSDSTLNRVTAYDVATITDGENAASVLGQTLFTTATAATTQAGMNVPFGLALSGSTTLFVSQGTGNRVTTYDVTSISDGENAVNVLGQANFTATALGNTQSGMNAPRGIAYSEATKKLYVSQTTGNRVTVYDVAAITDGENAVNVFGQTVFTSIGAAVTHSGLSGPTGVIIDAVNNLLYVLQSGASRISIFDLTGASGIGNGELAVNVLGQAVFTTATAAVTQAGMDTPVGLALSGSSVLFVAEDINNRVTAFNVTSIADGENAVNVLGQTLFTTATAASTQTGMNAPRGLTYDRIAKRLYVTQVTGNRITVYDVAAITNGENAIKILGQPTFTSAGAVSTQAGLNAPTGVTFDVTNNLLYVLQSGASRISTFDVASMTDGENAVDVLGQYDDEHTAPGPIYTKGTANNVSDKFGLSAPQGLAVDATNHRLFVADSSNNRVLIYNLNAQNVPVDRIPDNVLGQPNFYTNTVATTQMGLSLPTGLTFDSATNQLFVSDFTNNRIMVFDTASITDGENAVAVLGQAVFTLATAGTTQVGLQGPRQPYYDGTTGKLFVADATNSRVLLYDVNPTETEAEADSFYFFGF